MQRFEKHSPVVVTEVTPRPARRPVIQYAHPL